MRIGRWVALATFLAAAGCGGGVGACDGFSTVLERRYCQDNFSADECAEYDEMEVNGASWTFHEGQTCADRGCPGGGSCG
jgi:hypothetical protein